MNRIYAPALIVLFSAGLLTVTAGCQKQVTAKVEDPPRPVRVVRMNPVDTAERLDLPAEVRPRFETRYGFRVGGKISNRAVALGDQVKPGHKRAAF